MRFLNLIEKSSLRTYTRFLSIPSIWFNESVTTPSFFIPRQLAGWLADRRGFVGQFSGRQIRESASPMCSSDLKPSASPFPPPSSRLSFITAYALSLSLFLPTLPFLSLSLSLCYFLPLPRNWYYYGPVRPSHYVINVTRVDYRSLFRTCLQCPRTMLDPLPPSPPLLSPLTDSFLGPYAHRKNVNVENGDVDDDDELTLDLTYAGIRR